MGKFLLPLLKLCWVSLVAQMVKSLQTQTHTHTDIDTHRHTHTHTHTHCVRYIRNGRVLNLRGLLSEEYFICLFYLIFPTPYSRYFWGAGGSSALLSHGNTEKRSPGTAAHQGGYVGLKPRLVTICVWGFSFFFLNNVFVSAIQQSASVIHIAYILLLLFSC